MWLVLVMTFQYFACITFIMLAKCKWCPTGLCWRRNIIIEEGSLGNWACLLTESSSFLPLLRPYIILMEYGVGSYRAACRLGGLTVLSSAMIIVPTFVPVLPLMDIRPIKCDKSFCGDVVWRGDCIQLLMIRRRERDDHVYRFKSNMITKWFTLSVRIWKILWRENDVSFLKWNGIRIGRKWEWIMDPTCLIAKWNQI